jgi:hypothetical protein
MPGKNKASASGWTVDTLRSHCDDVRRDDRRYLKAMLAEKDRAVKDAYESMNRRLDGMNEFRQTLTEQAAQFMPRSEADQRMGAIEKQLSSMTGRSGGREDSWKTLVAIIGLLAILAPFVAKLIGHQ